MSKISEKLSRKLSLGIILLAVPIFIGTLDPLDRKPTSHIVPAEIAGDRIDPV